LRGFFLFAVIYFDNVDGGHVNHAKTALQTLIINARKITELRPIIDFFCGE
jgi:hypothetical protein